MKQQSSFPGVEVPPAGGLHTSPLTAPVLARSPSPSATVAEGESAASFRGGDKPSALERARARVLSSVWVLPAAKLVGFCCVLTCIAWLGERSRDTTIYGPELPASAAPEPVTSQPAKSPAGEQVAPPNAPPPALPAAAPPPCASASQDGKSAPPVSALLADGRLVLNEATAAELDRLPGIGKKRAEDIVTLRTRLKRFKRLEDLLRIRGIGPRSLASLKEHLVLDRPKVLEEKDAGADSGNQGRTLASPAQPPLTERP